MQTEHKSFYRERESKGNYLEAMIHHYSIPVHETEKVSNVIASLFGGTITRFGPYRDSYIVWIGDEFGTAIEFYPSGTEMIPDHGGGQANFIHNSSHTGFTATHAAISIRCTRNEIYKVAKENGWRALELPRGGFSVIEFWIENKVMLELLTPDMVEDYLSATAKFRFIE